ncbi:MAG: hypothetical protein ACREOV_04640, partial [Candidatus Dormibacteraceae bacterium]
DLEDVASVVTVPDGGQARVHTGVLVLDGDAFADQNNEGDVLVVTGSLIAITPVRHVAFAGMVVTGTVLAPEGSEAALGAGMTRLTGSFNTFPYREGQRVEHRSGDLDLRGAALANRQGTPDDVLLVSGNLTMTGEVADIGYARLVVAGTLIAPATMQDALEPYLSAQSALWYVAPPKVFKGSQTISRAFFQLLEEPVTLVLIGAIEIDADVTLDDVRPNIAAVFSRGALRAPRDVLGLFQVRGDLAGAVKAMDADD